jgi:hypothetical protein
MTATPDTTAPTRPEGVELHHADGTVTLCELAYVGVRDGSHIWSVLAVARAGDQLHIAVLPGHTGLTFNAALLD